MTRQILHSGIHPPGSASGTLSANWTPAKLLSRCLPNTFLLHSTLVQWMH